ncbi:MAG: Flp family type IVb pilin [Alphaproteobacteria bacterium]|nr:Flp family type IVb pilin [Alphaproteobacteria bacterium]
MIISRIKCFFSDVEGATAIEYSLLAALIGVTIAAGATTLGTAINDKFDAIGKALNPEPPKVP